MINALQMKGKIQKGSSLASQYRLLVHVATRDEMTKASEIEGKIQSQGHGYSDKEVTIPFVLPCNVAHVRKKWVM